MKTAIIFVFVIFQYFLADVCKTSSAEKVLKNYSSSDYARHFDFQLYVIIFKLRFFVNQIFEKYKKGNMICTVFVIEISDLSINTRTDVLNIP